MSEEQTGTGEVGQKPGDLVSAYEIIKRSDSSDGFCGEMPGELRDDIEDWLFAYEGGWECDSCGCRYIRGIGRCGQLQPPCDGTVRRVAPAEPKVPGVINEDRVEEVAKAMWAVSFSGTWPPVHGQRIADHYRACARAAVAVLFPDKEGETVTVSREDLSNVVGFPSMLLMPVNEGHPTVQGKCPACGWKSLFLGKGGYVTCSGFDCPNPSAATEAISGANEIPARSAPIDRDETDHAK